MQKKIKITSLGIGLLGLTLSMASTSLLAQSTIASNITQHKTETEKTLGFFNVKPNYKVIDVWPGEGTLTENLAPYLKDNGLLITALEPGNTPERKRHRTDFLNKLADDSDRYSNARLVTFDAPKGNLRPVGGVDVILTANTVQTWENEKIFDGTLGAFYTALKSGGELGIINDEAKSGVKNDLIISKAIAVGFEKDGQYHINKVGSLALRFKKPVDAPVPSDVVKFVRTE